MDHRSGVDAANQESIPGFVDYGSSNGGPFTSYPHLIRLLMDRNFRQAALARIHPQAAEHSTLKDLDREYTLDEVAIITRAAPARLLGLTDRGQVRPDAVADLVFYRPNVDAEAMFTQASAVWKSGRLLPTPGSVAYPTRPSMELIYEGGQATTLRSRPRPGLQLSEFWQDAIEPTLGVPVGALQISDDELLSRIDNDGRASLATAAGVKL